VYAGDAMKNKKHKRVLDECISFLDVNGIRMNEQLNGLITFFFSTDHHLSFEDIKLYILENKLEISDMQIRDTLALLIEYGFAIEKDFGDSIVRYEHLHYGEHHDHLYCFKCGKIIEFYSPVIEEQQLKEANIAGFHAFSHKMQIYGLCDHCFGKSSSQMLPLAMIEGGGKFKVREFSDGGPFFESGLKKKLIEMGLVPGMNGEVLTNHGGRIVVVVNGVRIALGRGMSQSIQVVLIE
jgi:Fur family transcriptional regulator, ferric uptake regulator